jgi:hypothetical protein
MCRSIKTLRPPYTDDPTPDDVRAAALQYVRKIAGMRAPSSANVGAFEAAVEEVAVATDRLLASLVVRSPARRSAPAASSGRHPSS